MFAIPGILGLVTFVFARPQDLIEALNGSPLLYIFFALAVFGVVIDLRRGHIRANLSPQTPWVLLWVVWCFGTMVIKAPGKIAHEFVQLVILVIVFLCISTGLQTFRGFEKLAGLLLVVCLFISAVCTHQGLSPFQCVGVDPRDAMSSMGRPDGRPCDTPQVCNEEKPNPEFNYRCEHVGLFGTTSIASGRVRYVGMLLDPNETSLAMAVSMPLSIAFFLRRKSTRRLALMLFTMALVGACVAMSKSRGGQLVFLAALGAYFIRRFGWKGIIAGGILGSPILLLGGRSGAEASQSSLERLECLLAGFTMFRSSPIVGVGYGQFTEHHFLTAHNSYMLAAAELGFPGMILWGIVYYLSVKIPVKALMRYQHSPEAQVSNVWSMALIACFAGMTLGIFFLSFNYHFVLWTYMGLSGALYAAIRTHDPKFHVSLTSKDFAFVSGIAFSILAFLFVYTNFKLRNQLT
jgi:O-antigen ligase